MLISSVCKQELLDKVTQFQKDALEALDAESPDSEKLEQLIEFSVTLDVDLQEIPRLKQVRKISSSFFVDLTDFVLGLFQK